MSNGKIETSRVAMATCGLSIEPDECDLVLNVDERTSFGERVIKLVEESGLKYIHIPCSEGYISVAPPGSCATETYYPRIKELVERLVAKKAKK